MKHENMIDLFGFPIMDATMGDALNRLLESDEHQTAAFLNAHCINIAARDVAYARVLDATDFLLPDGSGMQIAAKMTGRQYKENLNGSDLFPPLCRAAAARSMSVFLLGSQQGVAEAAAQAAVEIAPDLQIAGTRHGYFSKEDEAAVIEEINASGADILLVAMGVPMQELWIEKNKARLKPRLIMGVGAQFDFWSGRIRRAPIALRRMGFEWTWRLAAEPVRMFSRYVVGNPLFLLRAAKHAAIWHLRNGAAQRTVKRGFDIAVAGSALLALSPVFTAVAVAVKMDSRGAVFFRQNRVGRSGCVFSILKFRSMHRDAEARKAALAAESDRDGICFKSRNDPRITKVGAFLRRFSLDELPQLINVLKGEMSIVGPRPGLPGEVAAYPSHARGRLAVKPGITGIWQVSGRADIDFDRMIEMDLAYAKSKSLVLDILLLALTVRAALSGRGAY